MIASKCLKKQQQQLEITDQNVMRSFHSKSNLDANSLIKRNCGIQNLSLQDSLFRIRVKLPQYGASDPFWAFVGNSLRS